MKVLLIGANGQLGTDLQTVFRSRGISFVPLTHSGLDIRNAEAVAAAMSENKPDVVVSTAAFHKVEECEKQPATSFEVNASAVRNLAHECERAGSALVHFSTDYVFDGGRQTPYAETDLPRPLSVYGVSKLAGEYLVAAAARRYFLVRTCGLYGLAGSSGKGGNFVETMLKKGAQGVPIRVVNDQVLTPTYTGDLAEAVSRLIQTNAYGLYHVSAEGQCSWYDFARAIFDLERMDVDLKPVASSEYASPVQRPAYSVLSKQKLKGVGITMPDWKDALARYLSARRRSRPQTAGTPA